MEDKTNKGTNSMHETSDGFKEPQSCFPSDPETLRHCSLKSKAVLVLQHFLFEHFTPAKGQETYGNALLRVQPSWKHKSFLDSVFHSPQGKLSYAASGRQGLKQAT